MSGKGGGREGRRGVERVDGTRASRLGGWTRACREMSESSDTALGEGAWHLCKVKRSLSSYNVPTLTPLL